MFQGWVPYAIIAVSAVVLIGVTIVLARSAWRRQVRRYLVGLMGRREAVGAALKTAEGTVRTLASGTVQDLIAFTAPGSEERRAVSEIAERMRMERGELVELPLPKVLWPLADFLGAAADGLAVQMGGVGDAEGEAALDALAALDIASVKESLQAADLAIASLVEQYELTDPAVYGGGLYI